MSLQLLTDSLETPLGTVSIAVSETGVLRRVTWGELGEGIAAKDPFGVISALRAYFEGDIAAVEKLPVDGVGTEFQRRVWKALRQIPAGKIESYGALARRLGVPKAVRAVGGANGANPIGIVVPCHRVVGADGSLTGFAGGIPRKRWLLEHEARYAGTIQDAPAARWAAL